MFSAWKLDVSMAHAREKRGKYMLMMMQLKIGDVFKVWKKYTKENKRYSEISEVSKTKQKIANTKLEILGLYLNSDLVVESPRIPAFCQV